MTPIDSPGLVIFDCDGVLVDSEPLSAAVLIETLGAAGATIDAGIVYSRLLGRSMARVAAILAEDFGVAVDDALLDEMRARLYRRFRSELQPIPHVGETIAGLDRPFCVASSSQLDRIRLSLELTGLLDLFDPRLYSATMVREGKPAPDLFLHAAAQMGARPEECVVIEDSAAGVEAAQRAGMRVLAFVGGSHAAPAGLRAAAEALSPDAVFDDMRALPALLAGPISGSAGSAR